MWMDSFICGSCAAVFHDIGTFLQHKQICIPASLDKAHETVEVQQPVLVQATVLDADGQPTTFVIINGDVDNEVTLNSTSEVGSAGLADANLLCTASTSSQQNVTVEAVSRESGILS